MNEKTILVMVLDGPYPGELSYLGNHSVAAVDEALGQPEVYANAQFPKIKLQSTDTFAEVYVRIEEAMLDHRPQVVILVEPHGDAMSSFMRLRLKALCPWFAKDTTKYELAANGEKIYSAPSTIKKLFRLLDKIPQIAVQHKSLHPQDDERHYVIQYVNSQHNLGATVFRIGLPYTSVQAKHRRRKGDGLEMASAPFRTQVGVMERIFYLAASEL